MLQYANPAVVQLPLGTPEGLALVRTAENTIVIAPGKTLIRRASGASQIVVRATSLSKSVQGAWTQGGLGGRATSLGYLTNTVYHVYLIVDSNGIVDAYFDTSTTAANRPAGWDARMIGSFITTSSAILEFNQIGDRFEYFGNLDAFTTNNLSISPITIVTLPTPSVASAFGTIITYHASASQSISLASESDPLPASWCTTIPNLNLQTYWQINGNRMRLNASQVNTTVMVRVRGFIHPRGANG